MKQFKLKQEAVFAEPKEAANKLKYSHIPVMCHLAVEHALEVIEALLKLR